MGSISLDQQLALAGCWKSPPAENVPPLAARMSWSASREGIYEFADLL